MPKMKSRRGARKRFKKTGTGRWVRQQANRSHLNTKKSARRKRRLRGSVAVRGRVDRARLRRMLPYA